MLWSKGLKGTGCLPWNTFLISAITDALLGLAIGIPCFLPGVHRMSSWSHWNRRRNTFNLRLWHASHPHENGITVLAHDIDGSLGPFIRDLQAPKTPDSRAGRFRRLCREIVFKSTSLKSGVIWKVRLESGIRCLNIVKVQTERYKNGFQMFILSSLAMITYRKNNVCKYRHLRPSENRAT